jgi:hypothetical protein
LEKDKKRYLVSYCSYDQNKILKTSSSAYFPTSILQNKNEENFPSINSHRHSSEISLFNNILIDNNYSSMPQMYYNQENLYPISNFNSQQYLPYNEGKIYL